MESWHYTVIVVFLYALLILWVGTGRWTRVGRVAMDDYFKVAPGFGFLVLYLGIAGGFHTAFAIPGSMGFYHAHGVAFAANVLWTVFTPLGVIYFIGSRITCLGRKFNYITPADLLVDYFGDGKFRAFIAIYILSCCIPLMAANVTGPARLLSSGTEGNISYIAALAIMGFMVMIYVTSSGIRGVTWTTVAQAVWMFVAVWAAAFWCLHLIDGNLLTLFNTIRETEPAMLTLPGPRGLATPQWWTTFPVFGLALYWAILPRGFMFFYSSRSVKTTKRIGLTVGLYLMTLYLPAMVIGFTAFYFFPELTGSDADNSFPLLLATYAPAWFAGLIVAGGLAAGMSSMDADTNANSAMLTKDVYASFIKKDGSDRHYITIGRIFCCFPRRHHRARRGARLGSGGPDDRRHRFDDHPTAARRTGGDRPHGHSLYQGRHHRGDPLRARRVVAVAVLRRGHSPGRMALRSFFLGPGRQCTGHSRRQPLHNPTRSPGRGPYSRRAGRGVPQDRWRMTAGA